MRTVTKETLTETFLGYCADDTDPRLRLILERLAHHLHAFVKETGLTHAEWRKGIELLVKAGEITDAKGRLPLYPKTKNGDGLDADYYITGLNRNEPNAGFSPKAAYIFRKQLEEADFIVINQNILEIPVTKIHETKVLRTVLRGHTVHEGK